jgi:hypothetical protein
MFAEHPFQVQQGNAENTEINRTECSPERVHGSAGEQKQAKRHS